MEQESQYDFTSERLGFRNWKDSDLDKMLELNLDPEVMEHFPSTQDRAMTKAFIKRMQDEYKQYRFCYFALELKETQEFIGFIGISNQDYGKKLGKFVDIGWRLKKSVWGNGYATEGAKKCIQYAKEQIGLSEIFSVASKTNVNSIAVMKKIGMKEVTEFTHPKLIDYPHIKRCMLYQINL